MSFELPDGTHHITGHDVDNSTQLDVQNEWLRRALPKHTDDFGVQDDIATSWEQIYWPDEEGTDRIYECDTSATSPDVAMTTGVDMVEEHVHDDMDKVLGASAPWAYPSVSLYTPAITIEPEVYSVSDGGTLRGGTRHAEPTTLYPSTNSTAFEIETSKSPYGSVFDDLDATSDILDFGSESAPELLVCLMCNTTFGGKYRKGNLARHERLKHRSAINKVYNCQEKSCYKTFKRQDALLKHFRRHHLPSAKSLNLAVTPVIEGSIIQERDTFRIGASSIADLRRQSPGATGKEEELEEEDDDDEDDDYDDMASSALTTSELSHSLEDSSRTDVSISTSRDRYVRIVDQDDDETRTIRDRRIACTLCESTFQRTADLRRHMRKHEDHPLFLCEVPGCKKEFYRMDKLRDHAQKSHRGTVSTTDEGSLEVKVAEDAYVAEQPSTYKCTECSLEFRTPGQQRNHFNRKHNKRLLVIKLFWRLLIIARIKTVLPRTRHSYGRIISCVTYSDARGKPRRTMLCHHYLFLQLLKLWTQRSIWLA
ncbi:hypothetical protein BKA63DRAFT_170303 [Paraphoma chrysanthemicola]|nr:hypothetical protein BKA63DRAFT_170303 [Paraphoma chrysanthemicola]